MCPQVYILTYLTTKVIAVGRGPSGCDRTSVHFRKLYCNTKETFFPNLSNYRSQDNTHKKILMDVNSILTVQTKGVRVILKSREHIARKYREANECLMQAVNFMAP